MFWSHSLVTLSDQTLKCEEQFRELFERVPACGPPERWLLAGPNFTVIYVVVKSADLRYTHVSLKWD